ncbi:MAG: aminotransferase class V-fold PLP-dependent enzyme, partial [Clostridia bacterium]|nr:aminotransferase class V-fold PLP-dependent enzyme [Clostridia bacterium]
RFVSEVLERIDDIYYNGAKDTSKRLYNNANFRFRYIEGESILFSLDLAGICASSGSACSSGSLEPSRTLLAIGVPVGTAHGSIRFTFGRDNTVEDVDYTVDELVKTVEKLRAMSPLYKKK